MLKSTVSQQVERTETNEVSQRVEVDATPPSPVGSALEKTSPDVTPGGDHVAMIVLAQRPSTLVLMMINSCSYVYY